MPSSWIWCRLGNIFDHVAGKALNEADKEGRLHHYITTSNLYWDNFNLENLRSMYFKDSELEKCKVTKGDLLVCEGGDVGRAAIWDYEGEMCIQNHIHRLRPFIDLNVRFFYYTIYYYKSIGLIGGKGIGIQGLSSKALHSILLPLPPRKEQDSIVLQIELLFEHIK